MRLTEFIRSYQERIVDEWEAFARTQIPEALTMSRSELRDHAGEILQSIAKDIETPQTEEEQIAKSRGGGQERRMDQIADLHVGVRIESGFKLDQVVAEYRALRASVIRLWEDSHLEGNVLDLGELTRFNEAIDQAISEGVSRYLSAMREYQAQTLGILGHDLRNPLSAILMSASLLARSDRIDDRIRTVVTRITNSALRMNRLISDLLDLTRTRLGVTLPITKAPADLGGVCRQILDEIGAFHPDQPLRLETKGSLRGEWDSERLAQVVSNLVANALQHGSGAGPVTVSARGEGRGVVLEVHNEGPPIPQKTRQKIFEPMVRQSDREIEEGKPPTSLGLGLFIAREIVYAHGGTIGVRSSRKNGTTFTVRLPRH